MENALSAEYIFTQKIRSHNLEGGLIMASYFHVYFYKNIKRRRAGIREYRHMKKKKILKKVLLALFKY